MPHNEYMISQSFEIAFVKKYLQGCNGALPQDLSISIAHGCGTVKKCHRAVNIW
jgi:hypothetical protein